MSHGAGGSGGNTGQGGGAGKAAGGAGGSSAPGGSASGGNPGAGGAVVSGGSVGSGGNASGGSPGAGGAAAGSGGSASGGSVGMGGVPAEITGPGVFFSGKDMTFTKLRAGDAMPGYVNQAAAGVVYPVTIEAVSDPALPAGTKYAIRTDREEAGMLTFKLNWRQDIAPATVFNWNWFDASAFAGISFWAKADSGRIFFSATSCHVDSLGTDESASTACTFATRAQCGPCFVQTAIVQATWQRIVLPFAKFMPTAEFSPKGMGRLDMFSAGNIKMLATGITFLTAAELP